MMPFPLPRIIALAVLVLMPGAARAAGAEPDGVTMAPAPPADAAPVTPVVTGSAAGAPAKTAAPLNDTQRYCQNIAAAAADARFAWQRKQINDLQEQLKQRIADLQDKEAQFKAIIAKREEIMKKAADSVVGIYAHMKSDAAAAQLALLDDDMAAAILSQLSQRQASIILDQIPADRAAKLVGVMAAGSTLEKKS